MYNIYLKKTKDENDKLVIKNLRSQSIQRIKRERLSQQAHQRLQKWLQEVKPEEAKVINDGAHKQSFVVTSLGQEDQKLHEKSILNSTQNTFFDRIYVRKYEPDHVRRFRNEVKRGSVSHHLQDHMQPGPYQGSAQEIFRSLLRPRGKSTEKVSEATKKHISQPQSIQDAQYLDSAPKEMHLFYRPDFRKVTDPNQYKTIAQPDDKKKEKNFKLTFQKAKSTKLSQSVIEDPKNKHKDAIKKDWYVDGNDELGHQIDRFRNKSKELYQREFIVNTSQMNAPLYDQQTIQSSSIRKYDSTKIHSSLAPSLNRGSIIKINSRCQSQLGNIKKLNSSFKVNDFMINDSQNSIQSPLNRSLVINASFFQEKQKELLDISQKSITLKPTIIQANKENDKMIQNSQPANRVYMKSLELSESYMQLKKSQKERLKDELTRIKSLMSQEFDQVNMQRNELKSQQSSYLSKVLIKPVFTNNLQQKPLQFQKRSSVQFFNKLEEDGGSVTPYNGDNSFFKMNQQQRSITSAIPSNFDKSQRSIVISSSKAIARTPSKLNNNNGSISIAYNRNNVMTASTQQNQQNPKKRLRSTTFLDRVTIQQQQPDLSQSSTLEIVRGYFK